MAKKNQSENYSLEQIFAEQAGSVRKRRAVSVADEDIAHLPEVPPHVHKSAGAGIAAI